jgi:dTDP-4-amino-4,6-dideoxygalactose transaminase
MQTKIPFLDIKIRNELLKSEINAVIQEVIETSAFAGGPFVEKFEDQFKAFCDSSYAVGVGSGTEALWLSLLALGVGPGDEVITVSNTFMATAEAITYCGARPVFVDVDECTYTMDPAMLEKAITPTTKAVIPVHIFGQTADMDPILAIARKHGLYVIEDACQAHGAEYKGQKAGSLGDVGCFSFYPGKNLGAFGEAGAVVAQSFEVQEKIRILRDHGQVRKYHHTMVGWNSRMDGIQAAVLGAKLGELESGNNSRRSHAAHYDAAFSGIDGLVIPFHAPYSRHVYHVYAIRVQKRDQVMQALAENGIGCGVHYPVPVHLQEAYRDLGYKQGDFPVAEKCAREFISLPMFPSLTVGQLEFVVRGVEKAVGAEAMNGINKGNLVNGAVLPDSFSGTAVAF